MIDKRLVYANISALAVNGVIVTLVIAKTFPPVLGVLLFLGCLVAAVWCSCRIQFGTRSK